MKVHPNIESCSCGTRPLWVKGQHTIMLRCHGCGREGIYVGFAEWRKAVEQWNKMNGGHNG